MALILGFFCLSISLGMSLFTPIASSKLTGGGFIKLATSVALGSALIAFGLGFYLFSEDYNYLISLGVALVSMGLVYKNHEDDKTPFMWFLYGLQCLSLFVAIYFFVLNSGHFIFDYIALLSSSLFLGIITYSMVLGHWYLVVPGLTERPLKVSLYFMWGLLFPKVFLSLYEIMTHWDYFQEGSVQGAGYLFNWVALFMRFGWGHLIIGILSYFAYRLVRMRSIQSATGVLYVMCFFAIVGELVATYLFYRYGVLL